jgi:hypothetical protein
MTKARFCINFFAIHVFWPQVTARIPARPPSGNSWPQQEGQQWWSSPALSPRVHAHYLAAWVFANPLSSASPAHTATTTTKPVLHQQQREPLVWMICLNRHQEVRSVLHHRYCFPNKKEKWKPDEGRSLLAASFLLNHCGYVPEMLYILNFLTQYIMLFLLLWCHATF